MPWNRRNESCGSRPFGSPSFWYHTSPGTGVGCRVDGSSRDGSRQTSKRPSSLSAPPYFSTTRYSFPPSGSGGPRKKQSASKVSVVCLTSAGAAGGAAPGGAEPGAVGIG